jgi:hypothetical protein
MKEGKKIKKKTAYNIKKAIEIIEKSKEAIKPNFKNMHIDNREYFCYSQVKNKVFYLIAYNRNFFEKNIHNYIVDIKKETCHEVTTDGVRELK